MTRDKVNDGVEKDCRFGRGRRAWRGNQPILLLLMGREDTPIWKVLASMVWRSDDNAFADGPKEYSRFDRILMIWS